MAAFGYSFPWVVVDRATNQLAADRNDGALLDPTTRQPVPTFDQLGVQGPLRTGPYGVLRNFTSDLQYGIARFGETETLVISDRGLNALDEADQALAQAAAARAAVDAIAATATTVRYVGQDPDGRIWVSSTPVLDGGLMVIEDDGRVAALFPL